MLDCVLALPFRQLHPHPLITNNSMANAVVVEQALLLRALNVGEADSVHSTLVVARVFVLFFALEIC
jgi:hypothetical protein